MKRKLLLFASLTVLVSAFTSCVHERHHKDPHKKYHVTEEDSEHKQDVDDHMHDNMPH